MAKKVAHKNMGELYFRHALTINHLPVEDRMPGYYKKARALPVSLRQREVLEQIVRRHKSQQQHVKRAQIILLGGDGFGNGQIADELHNRSKDGVSLA